MTSSCVVYPLISSQMKGLAGTALHMWVVHKGAKVTDTPHCWFINLEMVPDSKLFVDGFKAVVRLHGNASHARDTHAVKSGPGTVRGHVIPVCVLCHHQ